ncbi:type I site-specific deoxyribonuclease, HsdR family [Chlorobium limicola DSM 245]|uniref:type I site-specific deoxyribonuclease n=1 Tax=Chlorobium limicola (strain DSM 245 / NBRC 103803 / 6330) TaxID=290315 RepID=B3EIG9_CHLL2|nr:type I restriction endonuclease [Chlorobium limicola]ACD91481.1 type I site-specific deoxyribonuclease, HsdR family [Chlorobium limicola DSM 245]
MTSNPYTEDQLVEQPAIGLFAELGWATVSALDETFGVAEPSPGHFGHSLPEDEGNGNSRISLGRETKGDVVLASRLGVALVRLNPLLPPEAITAAMDELTRDRSAMLLEAANREVYLLLKEGIRVSVADTEPSPGFPLPEGEGAEAPPSTFGRRAGNNDSLQKYGGQKIVRVRVVDWEHPENNDFLLVSQFSVTGQLYTCRPDLVGFVNGLPMVVIELKKPGVPARTAFDENLRHYKEQIPSLFWYNALLIASNGTESRVGSLTADWERFFEWKRIARENEPRRVSLEVMLRGTCDRSRFLDLVENFTLFSEHKAGFATPATLTPTPLPGVEGRSKSGLVKIIGQNHQFLGVNAAIASLLRIRKEYAVAATLTPTPLPEVEGQYRGGFYYSGLVERARELRQQQTPAEDIVWELLRDHRFEGLKFRRQHQIGNYIADFFCSEHKLVVEVDGDVHRSPEVVAKDSQRDAYLRSLGYTVIRFGNQLVLNNPAEFLNQIRAALQLPSTTGRGAGGEGNTPGSNGIGESLTHPSTAGRGAGGEGNTPGPKVIGAALTYPSTTGRGAGGEGNTPRPKVIGAALTYPSTTGRGAGGEGNTPRPNGIGVFWQTQGSGKSFSMVFFAQKVLRKVAGNWTFVVVTDRIELDEQIAKTFKAAGAVSKAEGDACHASSGDHLRQLLRGNHRYVFTLIHKFRSETPSPRPSPKGRGGEEVCSEIPSLGFSPTGRGGEGICSETPGAGNNGIMPVLSDRADIIVLTDEAHRSQYDTLALNMRSALPNAMFLAFTGTPLIAGEERTKEVFGDYVSIYDFQQSVEDGATVPLFYENRTPELQLVNPDLNDDIYRLIEDAELDPDQESKLERELNRQYHLLTRDDRLDTVAKDIVRHFLGRGFIGKAMMVSIDKATAIRMYDKVQRFWMEETGLVRQQLVRYDLSSERKGELQKRLQVLESTDMAVIVSPGQNEIGQMQQIGLDIVKHRKRMVESQPALDEKFKDSDDTLRIVFVCAMWLTGFDAPSCSTVYLDKPMRNHTLMQTIARANRVFPGKHSGMIVDYANVFASLEKALAIYGAGKGGHNPVRGKDALVEELRKAVELATAFCMEHGVHLAGIEEAASGMERLQRIEDAVNALIGDTLRREFFGHERLVRTLYQAVKPDPAAIAFSERVACIAAIAEAIRGKLNPVAPDISTIMQGIGRLLDESITGHAIRESGPPVLDLSKINFKALSDRFRQSKHRNTDLEMLKAAINAKLENMIRLNRTRADFAGKFEELIAGYNAGSRSIEDLFDELLKLSLSLSDEEQRHVRENMNEEELVIFDILTRPAPELNTDERSEVKRVARELLVKIKGLLVLNWRQKTEARSRLKLTIEDALDQGLPRAYTPEIYRQKCSAVFEHVYESYPERDAGVYAEVE